MNLSLQEQLHLSDLIRTRFSIPTKWPICLHGLEFFASKQNGRKPIPEHTDEELLPLTNFGTHGFGHSATGLGMVEFVAEKTTSPTVLHLLAQHPQWTVLMRVAGNRHTDLTDLKTLSQHWQESVRRNANYWLQKKQDNG